MNSPGQMIVVCPHKGIAEVPGVICKCIIINGKTKVLQVLHNENCRGCGISFTKGMNLFWPPPGLPPLFLTPLPASPCLMYSSKSNCHGFCTTSFLSM